MDRDILIRRIIGGAFGTMAILIVLFRDSLKIPPMNVQEIMAVTLMVASMFIQPAKYRRPMTFLWVAVAMHALGKGVRPRISGTSWLTFYDIVVALVIISAAWWSYSYKETRTGRAK